jgi:hypothetical protein
MPNNQPAFNVTLNSLVDDLAELLSISSKLSSSASGNNNNDILRMIPNANTNEPLLDSHVELVAARAKIMELEAEIEALLEANDELVAARAKIVALETEIDHKDTEFHDISVMNER